MMREEKEITWKYERRVATLVILKSDNPQAEPKDWTPVKNDDVPEWLKNPDILGQMVDGNVASDKVESPGVWWRCEVVFPDETEAETVH